jgi:hypothetical protein
MNNTTTNSLPSSLSLITSGMKIDDDAMKTIDVNTNKEKVFKQYMLTSA